MFLIIEGIHDTGKTTLIDKLCKRGYVQFQAKRLFPELADAKNIQVSDFAFGVNCSVVWFADAVSKQKHVLFDRLHLSEYAYGRVIRDTDRLDAVRKLEMIDNALNKSDVRLVYLHCDFEVAKSRRKSKNKVYDKRDYVKLTAAFDNALKVTRLPLLKIDTGETDVESVFDKVAHFIDLEDR